MRATRTRNLLWWFAAAILLLVTMVEMDAYLNRPVTYSDFAPDYAAARAATHRDDAYAPTVTLIHRYMGSGPTYYRERQRDSHPPSLLLLLTPWTLIRPGLARVLWLAGNLFAIGLAVWLVTRAAAWSRNSATFAVAAVLAMPVTHDVLSVAQNEGFLMLAVAAFMVLRRRGLATAAGVLLGITIAAKLYPALLLVVLWRRGERRICTSAAGAAATLMLAGIVFVGVNATRDWLRAASPENLRL